MNEYPRDTTVIETGRVSWTEGKTVGFIPWSIFTKDESANKAEERVLFFQAFGLSGPFWVCLDERYFPEATEADYYDAKNLHGRWDFVKYAEEGSPTHLEFSKLSISEMIMKASLSEGEEKAGHGFYIVRRWQSFISHDDHLRLLQKEEEKIWRGKLELEVKEACGACSAGDQLYKKSFKYFHRKNFAFVRCEAEDNHYRLETKAKALYNATTKSHYRLLRGELNKYNRFNSSPRLIRSHGAFRKLVEMGPEAVPFVLSDLRKGSVGGIWSAEILAELTGRRGVNPEWWLAWADAEKYEMSHDA